MLPETKTFFKIPQDYPANTVRGRICLGERLNWDKDRRKETSDIYNKPRYIKVIYIKPRYVKVIYIKPRYKYVKYDIYIKPRMIAVAVSFLSFMYFLYLRHKCVQHVNKLMFRSKCPGFRFF